MGAESIFPSDGQNAVDLTSYEEDELIDLRSDGSLKILFRESSLDMFWAKAQKEFPRIGQKAVRILLQFSTSYLCEVGFSRMTIIKSQRRERLLIVEEVIKVALTSTPPNIERIFANLQSHPLH